MIKLLKLAILLSVMPIFSMQHQPRAVGELDRKTTHELNRRFDEIFKDPKGDLQSRVEGSVSIIKSNPAYTDTLLRRSKERSDHERLQQMLFVFLMIDRTLTERIAVLEKFTQQDGFTVNFWFQCAPAELTVSTTPMHRAVEALDIPLIRFLCEHGADLTLKNKDNGVTPLESYKKYLDYLKKLGYKETPSNSETIITLLTPGK